MDEPLENYTPEPSGSKETLSSLANANERQASPSCPKTADTESPCKPTQIEFKNQAHEKNLKEDTSVKYCLPFVAQKLSNASPPPPVEAGAPKKAPDCPPKLPKCGKKHFGECTLVPAAPGLAELGQKSREVFCKNYNLGRMKLDLLTESPLGMMIAFEGVYHTANSSVDASLEAVHNVAYDTIVIKESWKTGNLLTITGESSNVGIHGIQFGVKSEYCPDNGKSRLNMFAGCKMANINMNTMLYREPEGCWRFTGGVVGMLKGWLAGIGMRTPLPYNHLQEIKLAVGYRCETLDLYTYVNESKEYGGSIHQNINDKLQTSVKLSWDALKPQAQYGLGLLYVYDEKTTFRFKCHNAHDFAFGLSQKLFWGLTVHLAAILNAVTFPVGHPQFGFAVDIRD